jgi:Protein of unknown function (DUF3667)
MARAMRECYRGTAATEGVRQVSIEAEGLGEAVTGGMLARAVEPEAGEQDEQGQGRCLNCGEALVGAYCHACGQPGHIHRTVAAWWHDLAHGVLHFEGKIWRTLPMLAWRPGELTRRYIHGERARFVSPLAPFLFSVFLMFAAFSAAGVTAVGVENVDDVRSGIRRELGPARQRLDQLEQQRAAAARRGEDVRARDAAIRSERAQLETMSRLVESDGALERPPEVRTGWARLDHGIEKGIGNPQLLFYKLQSNAYKFGWALIPISLPFLWLLFLHRRRYRATYKAYDHLVFVTYSIAFMSLLLIAFVLLRTIGLRGPLLNLAFFGVAPVHMYRQLRGAYALSRLSAIWRTAALVAFAAVAMFLFLLLLLALGVLA